MTTSTLHQTIRPITRPLLWQSSAAPDQAEMGILQWCAKYEIDADVAAVLDHEFASVAALVSIVSNPHIDGKSIISRNRTASLNGIIAAGIQLVGGSLMEAGMPHGLCKLTLCFLEEYQHGLLSRGDTTVEWRACRCN